MRDRLSQTIMATLLERTLGLTVGKSLVAPDGQVFNIVRAIPHNKGQDRELYRLENHTTSSAVLAIDALDPARLSIKIVFGDEGRPPLPLPPHASYAAWQHGFAAIRKPYLERMLVTAREIKAINAELVAADPQDRAPYRERIGQKIEENVRVRSEMNQALQRYREGNM